MSPGEGSRYDIFVMNADGTDMRRLTSSPSDDGWRAWSPDGRQIVFTSQRDDCAYSEAKVCLSVPTGNFGHWHTLYVMKADGTDQYRLTRTFGQFAVWSPGGQYILFAPWLNVIRPDGTGLTANHLLADAVDSRPDLNLLPARPVVIERPRTGVSGCWDRPGGFAAGRRTLGPADGVMGGRTRRGNGVTLEMKPRCEPLRER